MDQTRFKQVSVNMRAHWSTRPAWELISRGKSSGHFRDHTCDYSTSLFAPVEADEIRRETSRLSSLVDRNLRARQRQKTLDSFLVSS